MPMIRHSEARLGTAREATAKKSTKDDRRGKAKSLHWKDLQNTASGWFSKIAAICNILRKSPRSRNPGVAHLRQVPKRTIPWGAPPRSARGRGTIRLAVDLHPSACCP